MNEPLAVVIFQCHHASYFAKPFPNVGDYTYCLRCGGYQTVRSVRRPWRVKCLDCTYGRQYGAARLAAESAADKHQRRYPRHKINVYDGTKVASTREPDPNQLALNIVLADDDPPPF